MLPIEKLSLFIHSSLIHSLLCLAGQTQDTVSVCCVPGPGGSKEERKKKVLENGNSRSGEGKAALQIRGLCHGA